MASPDLTILQDLAVRLEAATGPGLEKRTTEVARRHGCDRAVFTVCWGELEQGLTCHCKEDARAELLKEAEHGH